MYLGEVSPSDLRGRLVCIHVMFVSIGMFISQTLSAPHILGNKTGKSQKCSLRPIAHRTCFIIISNLSSIGFPILMSIPAIIAFFQFVLLLRFPESPPYLLIQKQDEEGARKGNRILMTTSPTSDQPKKRTQEQHSSVPNLYFKDKAGQNSPSSAVPERDIYSNQPLLQPHLPKHL